MVVGVCRLTLMVPESQSLKQKRQVIRKIKDRCRNKFNLAIAEVDSQDAWQEAVLGFSVVANDEVFVRSMVDRILDFIDHMAVAKLVNDERDFVNYGDELRSSGWEHWEPEFSRPPDSEEE